MTPPRERQVPLLQASFVVAILAAVGVRAAEPAVPPASQQLAVDQHGPNIKDTYKDHFLIGMAGDLPGNYSDQEMGLVKQDFNIVTPENCMKPGPIHPRENTWRFERPDALVKWGTDNNIGVHGHTLVWHAQTSDWWSTAGIPYAALDKAISDYASLGLKVSITELDVTIRGASGGQFGPRFGGRRLGGGAPPTPQDLNAQADAYARLFSILIKHQAVMDRVTFWGLSDGRTWRFGQHPLIFDSNNKRKPAYAAIVDALRHPKPE